MGIFDKLLRRGKDTAAEHGDELRSGTTKAADFVDEKTDRRFEGAVDKAEEAVESAVDRLEGDPAAGERAPNV